MAGERVKNTQFSSNGLFKTNVEYICIYENIADH